MLLNRNVTSRLRRVLLPVSAAALLLSACASGPAEIASPLGTLEVVPLTEDAALANAFDPAATELVGPHFALAVAGSQFSERIDAAAAQALGLAGPLNAPAGYEVVVTQLASDYSREPSFKDDGAAQLALELGDEQRAVGDFPKSGDVIVAMAPKDKPAKLVVTDAERRFTVNLRDGAREEYSESFLADLKGFAEPDGHYEKAIKVETPEWIISFDTYAEFELQRGPWLADHGWAADGKVWVSLEFAVQYLWKGDGDLDVEWVLDPAGSVKFKAGGATVEPADKKTGEKANQFIEYSLLYELPADTAKVEFTYKPKGDIKVDGKKGDVTKGPNSKDFTVDFGG